MITLKVSKTCRFSNNKDKLSLFQNLKFFYVRTTTAFPLWVNSSILLLRTKHTSIYYTLPRQKVYSVWYEAKEMTTLPYAEDLCDQYACRRDEISFPLFIQCIFRILTFYSGHVLARYSKTNSRNTHMSRTRQMFTMLQILANFLPLRAVIEMCLFSDICKTWVVYERGKLRSVFLNSDNVNRNFPNNSTKNRSTYKIHITVLLFPKYFIFFIESEIGFRQNHVPWGRFILWKWVTGISPGVKAAGAFGWRPTTLVVPEVEKIRDLNLPGTPRATSACRGIPLLFTEIGVCSQQTCCPLPIISRLTIQFNYSF